jgi:hypothetical protein
LLQFRPYSHPSSYSYGRTHPYEYACPYADTEAHGRASASNRCPNYHVRLGE